MHVITGPPLNARSTLRELLAREVEDNGSGNLVGDGGLERLVRRVGVEVVVALGGVAERDDPCVLRDALSVTKVRGRRAL